MEVNYVVQEEINLAILYRIAEAVIIVKPAG